MALPRPLRALLGSLVPCAVCGRSAAGAEGACRACLARFAASDGGAAPLARDGPYAVWAGPYDGPHRRAVRALKYGGRRDVARPLARALARRVRDARLPVARVAPVPLHPLRRLRRGYDQAAVLARRVAAELGVPYRPTVRRVRATRRQARLEGRARDTNVRNAFRSAPVPPVPVLLVDDVLTTGATVTACAQALRTAGARSVSVAVVCYARPAGDVRLRLPAWAQIASSAAVMPPSSAPTSTCG